MNLPVRHSQIPHTQWKVFLKNYLSKIWNWPNNAIIFQECWNWKSHSFDISHTCIPWFNIVIEVLRPQFQINFFLLGVGRGWLGFWAIFKGSWGGNFVIVKDCAHWGCHFDGKGANKFHENWVTAHSYMIQQYIIPKPFGVILINCMCIKIMCNFNFDSTIYHFKTI